MFGRPLPEASAIAAVAAASTATTATRVGIRMIFSLVYVRTGGLTAATAFRLSSRRLAAVQVPDEASGRREEGRLTFLGDRLAVGAEHDLPLAVLARERDRDVAEGEAEVSPRGAA